MQVERCYAAPPDGDQLRCGPSVDAYVLQDAVSSQSNCDAMPKPMKAMQFLKDLVDDAQSFFAKPFIPIICIAGTGGRRHVKARQQSWSSGTVRKGVRGIRQSLSASAN